eukprot:5570429-Amphidinium_carterae.1
MTAILCPLPFKDVYAFLSWLCLSTFQLGRQHPAFHNMDVASAGCVATAIRDVAGQSRPVRLRRHKLWSNKK